MAAEWRFIVLLRGSLFVGAMVELHRDTLEWPLPPVQDLQLTEQPWLNHMHD